MPIEIDHFNSSVENATNVLAQQCVDSLREFKQSGSDATFLILERDLGERPLYTFPPSYPRDLWHTYTFDHGKIVLTQYQGHKHIGEENRLKGVTPTEVDPQDIPFQKLEPNELIETAQRILRASVENPKGSAQERV